MSGPFREIEQRLGHVFARHELLQEAMTHPSFASEYANSGPHNQRLEFLGDAVLQLVATEFLYGLLPEHQEGELSKIRAAFCRQSALSAIAREMGLGECILLGRGEAQSGGRDRNSNLADGLEALLGALYLDAGLDPVRRFLTACFTGRLAQAEQVLRDENPKGALQEITQRRHGAAPNYTVVGVSGPDRPQFEVSVWLQGELLATATGNSRKEAEKQAAIKALERFMA